MTSHPLIYDLLCTRDNMTSTLWVHTIVETKLHPMNSWHHTHYTRHDTHENTKVISAISHSISDTTSTVFVSSNPGYQFHLTHSCMSLHTICMTSHSVCMTSHEHFMISHPYRYDITSTIFIHHIQYIWYHSYCFMKTTRLYLASHPLYLTSQKVHLCGHTRSINVFTTIREVSPLGKV